MSEVGSSSTFDRRCCICEGPLRSIPVTCFNCHQNTCCWNYYEHGSDVMLYCDCCFVYATREKLQDLTKILEDAEAKFEKNKNKNFKN